MCLHQFDNYQGTVAPNCFNSHTNCSSPDFVVKIVFPDVRSKIHFVQHNIVSTGQFGHA